MKETLDQDNDDFLKDKSNENFDTIPNQNNTLLNETDAK
jgi:hypothetical protein